LVLWGGVKSKNVSILIKRSGKNKQKIKKKADIFTQSTFLENRFFFLV